MLLRLLMVGAVTVLGFDLPSQCNVDRWVSSGQAWWNSQVSTIARLMPGTDEEIIDAAPADSEEPKLANEAPMPDGVDAFTAGESSPAPELLVETPMPSGADAFSAATSPATSAPFGTQEISAKELVADDAAFAAVVDAMVSSFVPQAPVVHVEGPKVADDLYPGVAFALNRDAEGITPQATPAEVAKQEPVASDETPATTERRFETALRLTGKAVEAWVALLQTPAVLSTEH